MELDYGPQRLEALLTLIKELSGILGTNWNDIPQLEIKERINNSIKTSLEIAI